MRQILKELNEEAEFVGSMVITPDGIMAAAVLGRDFEEDAMAAFAASLLVSLKRGLVKLRAASGLTSCTLTGTSAKVVFFDMDNSYLVLVANVDSQVDARADAIQRAIHRIKNRRVA
jgi:predicted regulator of Ras-like GTPase activity (Roadblock/LC7/MglB family)